MLLLMLHAKLDEFGERGISVAARCKELAQARIHMGAIGQNLLAGRARQQATIRAGMARACGLVIGIEEEGEAFIKGAVAIAARKDEGFEEPGRMGQMPLGGAGVVHGLNRLVLGGQRFGKLQRQAPCGEEPPLQLGFHRLRADGHA